MRDSSSSSRSRKLKSTSIAYVFVPCVSESAALSCFVNAFHCECIRLRACLCVWTRLRKGERERERKCLRNRRVHLCDAHFVPHIQYWIRHNYTYQQINSHVRKTTKMSYALVCVFLCVCVWSWVVNFCRKREWKKRDKMSTIPTLRSAMQCRTFSAFIW